MNTPTPRIRPIDFSELPAPIEQTVRGFRNSRGRFTNFIKTLANAPTVLEAYLAFSEALDRSALPDTVQAKIALAVSELNSSEYDVASHSAHAAELGLSEEEIELCRKASPSSPREEALLRFAQNLVSKQGNLNEAEWEEALQYSDDEKLLVEAVATIAHVHFANLINNLSRTALDADRPKVLNHHDSKNKY